MSLRGDIVPEAISVQHRLLRRLRLLAMTLFVFSPLIFLPGCATVAASFNPQVTADSVAAEAHLTKQPIQTSTFKLAAYSRTNEPGKPLTIYIEGDGRAWLSKHELAPDPTPFHLMMLRLAAMDPSWNVAYLGRPCQYDSTATQKPCESAYWSNKRFSEEVITSTNEAVDALKKESGASEIHLIGYSGGGAVAVLVAAKRQDVASLRTIAGNLDPDALNEYHHATPLDGLDPMDVAFKISVIPQRHFIGTEDKVVPDFISKNFMQASGNGPCIQRTSVPGATHHSGWEERWPELLKLPVSCV